jgi:hypothetical protein
MSMQVKYEQFNIETGDTLIFEKDIQLPVGLKDIARQISE